MFWKVSTWPVGSLPVETQALLPGSSFLLSWLEWFHSLESGGRLGGGRMAGVLGWRFSALDPSLFQRFQPSKVVKDFFHHYYMSRSLGWSVPKRSATLHDKKHLDIWSLDIPFWKYMGSRLWPAIVAIKVSPFGSKTASQEHLVLGADLNLYMISWYMQISICI